MKLIIRYYEFDDIHSVRGFDTVVEAVEYCEDKFGLTGEQWEKVKAQGDLEKLYEYLYQDGIDVELMVDSHM